MHLLPHLLQKLALWLQKLQLRHSTHQCLRTNSRLLQQACNLGNDHLVKRTDWEHLSPHQLKLYHHAPVLVSLMCSRCKNQKVLHTFGYTIE